jgi:hypothetical protein
VHSLSHKHYLRGLEESSSSTTSKQPTSSYFDRFTQLNATINDETAIFITSTMVEGGKFIRQRIIPSGNTLIALRV